MSLKHQFDKFYDELSSDFIEFDPISIPHRYTQLEDIEIAAFFSAIFAWGRRSMIISKCNELMALMNESPFDFIQNYSELDFVKIKNFKHRTFNASDLDYYCRALHIHYQNHTSLETAFKIQPEDDSIGYSIDYFYNYIKGLTHHESRNLKHISTPKSKSACKRLCMFLRWMVREDEIDFGLWKSISSSQLVIPLDIHVMNVGLELGLIDESDKANWSTAIKLTQRLKEFNSDDPVKYDLVLFSMGVSQKKII